MARPVLLGSLITALEGQPDGLDRVSLQSRAGLKRLTAQQLRRLLQPLIAQGVIEARGRTKSRRYRLVAPTAAVVAVPLSPPALALSKRLSRALQTRSPVGYRREFLDRYVPNRSFFLSERLRGELSAAGETGHAADPAGTFARQMLQRFLIDLSWNSSRLEGNTYSLLDTEKLLARGESASEKNQLETQMLLNHKAAIEYLVGLSPEVSVEERVLKNAHALLTDNLLAGPLDGGRVRTSPIGIGESVLVPLANPQVILECFRQLVATAAAIVDPFEQAFFLLAQLPYLRPFIDGNKRTARLAANIPFIRHNLIPLSFVDVPRDVFLNGMLAVYEENRLELLRDVFEFAYRRSCAKYQVVRSSLGEPDPFRLKHRNAIREVVAEIVRARAHGQSARALAANYGARVLPEEARLRFEAVIQTELEGLHDGNFARYPLRPSEFEAWFAGRPASNDLR